MRCLLQLVAGAAVFALTPLHAAPDSLFAVEAAVRPDGAWKKYETPLPRPGARVGRPLRRFQPRSLRRLERWLRSRHRFLYVTNLAAAGGWPIPRAACSFTKASLLSRPPAPPRRKPSFAPNSAPRQTGAAQTTSLLRAARLQRRRRLVQRRSHSRHSRSAARHPPLEFHERLRPQTRRHLPAARPHRLPQRLHLCV